MKYVLAYTTVAVLGTLVMLLGPGTELAVKAMVVFLVAHALYKAALFQVAGNVDHGTGTRDLMLLGGLRSVMPLTAAAAVLAALSKSGFPGTLGFLGKELIYKAKIDLDTLGVTLVIVALLGNIFLTATALMVAWWPFFGRRRETPEHPHEVPWTMWLGPVLMGVTSVSLGVVPWLFETSVGNAMASAVLGRPKEMKLEVIPPFTQTVLIAFGLSLATLAGGFALFIALRRLMGPMQHAVAAAGRVGPTVIYERGYDALLAGSKRLTGVIQNGYLRVYLLIVVAMLVGLVSVPLVGVLPITPAPSPYDLWTVHAHEVLLVLIIAGSAVAAIFMKSKLPAIAALGVTGFGIALLFTLFSAPDLALTQIMVETLTVILLVFVFYVLPTQQERRSRWSKAGDLLLALAGGSVMALLVLGSFLVTEPRTISDTMSRWSQPEAYGNNIVNVILVDFRALDTLGEVLVVAVAAVGVYALLRLRPSRSDGGRAEP